MLHERETEAAPAPPQYTRRLRSIKAFENPTPVLGGNTDATIGDLNFDGAIDGRDGHADILVFIRVLYGVVQEVYQRLRDGVAVCEANWEFRRDLAGETESLVVEVKLIRAQRVGRDLTEVRGDEVVCLLVRFDTREVENVVDEVRQTLALPRDDLVVVLPLLRFANSIQRERLSEESNQRQRSLQLVRHVGDEIGLHVREKSFLSKRQVEADESQHHAGAESRQEYDRDSVRPPAFAQLQPPRLVVETDPEKRKRPGNRYRQATLGVFAIVQLELEATVKGAVRERILALRE